MMPGKDFKYRRNWLDSVSVIVMILAGLVLYLGISFGNHSYIFDGLGFSHHYWAYAVMLVCIVYAGKCWHDALDNTTVLLINTEGIHFNNGTILWEDLAGYKMRVYQDIDAEGGTAQHCVFDFVDGRPEIILKLDQIEVRMDQIIKAITTCSSNPNIVFRGYENITRKDPLFYK